MHPHASHAPLSHRLVLAVAFGLAGVTAGCGGGSSGSAGATAAPAGNASATGPDLAALVREEAGRRRQYLEHAAGGPSASFYRELSRLALGRGPIDRAPIDDALQFMVDRRDTADFKATAALRLLYLFGQSPLVPAGLSDRAKQTLLGFRYTLDEPGRDDMVFWSENHQILFAQSAYLAGSLYPQETFSSSGLTGAALAARARPKILRWLEHRWRFGFSEWCSPVYYPHDVSPLLNLVDFAPDTAIRTRAAMVLDLLLFDLARLSVRGSFGVSAGRVYARHKLSGRDQSIGDLSEVLFGERGGFRSFGSTAATPYATSPSYRVPHALLAIGRDHPSVSVERARIGIALSEGPSHGIGFTSLADGLIWWGMGAYATPETIILSRRMLDTYQLWHQGFFSRLRPLRGVPDALLPPLAATLSPLTRGSVLTPAHLYVYRTPDAMLSSVLSYRKGQTGFQQHAWQATLDLDACVFTTAPGNLGHDGPDYWTGSGSLPRVVQTENVLLALYNPSLVQLALFPAMTHAWFPRSGFDEVRQVGGWTFGRKGAGYVGLYSAQPVYPVTQGPYTDGELTAAGARNVWICQVGREATDGPFDDFTDRLVRARVQVSGLGSAFSSPLSVGFDAPGRGTIEAAWSGTPTLDGQPIPLRNADRYDSPYSRTPFGARSLEIRLGTVWLRHDLDRPHREGTGL